MASLTAAKRLVVKIGSALLVDRETGDLRQSWLASLAEDVAWLNELGVQVILVSSGSIALGRGMLGLPQGELLLEQSQAAAAVGQIRLARAYQEALAVHDMKTAQVLVTLEDSANRRRYLNSRATLDQLLAFGVVPIVNENDTIATDEIRYGDNDRLAAQVAATVSADQLVLLSDVDGFYSSNPGVDPTAKHFATIRDITPQIEAMAGDAVSGLSKGGMKTKIMAAKIATAAGCAMAITLGSPNNPLKNIENGAKVTWFLADGDPQAARKRWIATMPAKGTITVDQGAVTPLKSGKSLLPAGISAVSGNFERGDPVDILGPQNDVLGHGLTRYSSDEARSIMGRQSRDIPAILGYAGRAVCIHRDDMVI